MAFDPSIGRAASQDGINASRAPYADGSAGTKQSLDAMAQKMREGRLDPAMKEWAVACLRAKGIDGRDNVPVRRQVQALLDCLRDQAIYVPDAYGAEVVQSGAATLCLRPNLCIRGGDCDDLSVALGSATMSIGIPTAIVKQSYGAEHQEHVLIACNDEGGQWFYADPSTNWPVGRAANALDEVWVDPLGAIGYLPEAHAEIITMGKPARIVARFAQNTTPHWGGTGVGAFFGYPTAQDLFDLLKTIAYNMQQLQVAQTACAAGFPDAAAWTQWQQDLNVLQADVHNFTIIANNYFNDTARSLWPYLVVINGWDEARGLVDREIDLDRRWRQSGAKCTTPDYSNEPQPQVDPDLVVLQASDSALKAVKAAADKAVAPTTLLIGGLVLGAAAAVGAVFLIDRYMPSKAR